MKQLEVTPTNALTAYKNADAKGKQLLENLFGKEFFSQKITDRVKTFEDACEVLGIEEGAITLGIKRDDSYDDASSLFAYAMLILIARSLNEGWVPDWNDSSQYKYYPYFEQNKSGFGFSRTHYADWNASTGVGSRLCYRTRELAEYAGKQFEAIYNNFLSLKKP